MHIHADVPWHTGLFVSLYPLCTKVGTYTHLWHAVLAFSLETRTGGSLLPFFPLHSPFSFCPGIPDVKSKGFSPSGAMRQLLLPGIPPVVWFNFSRWKLFASQSELIALCFPVSSSSWLKTSFCAPCSGTLRTHEILTDWRLMWAATWTIQNEATGRWCHPDSAVQTLLRLVILTHIWAHECQLNL